MKKFFIILRKKTNFHEAFRSSTPCFFPFYVVVWLCFRRNRNMHLLIRRFPAWAGIHFPYVTKQRWNLFWKIFRCFLIPFSYASGMFLLSRTFKRWKTISLPWWSIQWKPWSLLCAEWYWCRIHGFKESQCCTKPIKTHFVVIFAVPG